MLFNLWENRVVRYIVGGALTYLIKVSLAVLLIDYFSFISFIGYALALLSTIIVGYFYNEYITFRSKKGGIKTFSEYFFAKGVFHLIDIISVTVLAQYDFISTFYAVTLITFILFFFKFFVFKKIFKEKN